MYLLTNFHKHKLSPREIIDTKNTTIDTASIWVDYHLQKTKKWIPTYPQDSNHILNELKRLYPLSQGAKSFTTYVVSMYLNINTDEGLTTVRLFLKPTSKNYQ